MTMKYTISESTKTVTVETTESGETLGQIEKVVRTLAAPVSWDEVKREAVRLFDPLEDVHYSDAPSYMLAAE